MAEPVAATHDVRQRHFPPLSVRFSFGFIREKPSFKGGTVNRPQHHVSHRKQTIGHQQGRNFPVQLLFSSAMIKKSQFSIASGSLLCASDGLSEDSCS